MVLVASFTSRLCCESSCFLVAIFFMGSRQSKRRARQAAVADPRRCHRICSTLLRRAQHLQLAVTDTVEPLAILDRHSCALVYGKTMRNRLSDFVQGVSPGAFVERHWQRRGL